MKPKHFMKQYDCLDCVFCEANLDKELLPRIEFIRYCKKHNFILDHLNIKQDIDDYNVLIYNCKDLLLEKKIKTYNIYNV